MMTNKHSATLSGLLLALVLATCYLAQEAEAGQGCPFDDGSCQEYCNQQGCNMGYCGHFAWIQCICRKCGDEWSYYDKVRYNPDKAVNQTELDSLKLNGTSPLILVSSEQPAQGAKTTNTLKYLLSSTSQPQQQQQQAEQKVENKTIKENNRPASLTTLLIPDLSDTSKIDLNDIPEENSDKFLDYLAKNHEKLVQATSAESQARSSGTKNEGDEQPEEETSDSSDSSSATTTTSSPIYSTTMITGDEETVEIQISSSNNNLRIGQD